MYLQFLLFFKLHHKNGTSYFFLFRLPFVGEIVMVRFVKYLKLEDTLLTHLIAYSTTICILKGNRRAMV